MSALGYVLNYLGAFVSTVVISCAHPANWESCFPVDAWLVPFIHDVVHMHKDGAYHSEKCALNQ
jgi:hypothetical protein